jgi:hypothetical protein
MDKNTLFFKKLYEILESGQGYSHRDVFWVDKQVTYERLYRFAEEHKYLLRINEEKRRYEIYNLRNPKMLKRLPSLRT